MKTAARNPLVTTSIADLLEDDEDSGPNVGPVYPDSGAKAPYPEQEKEITARAGHHGSETEGSFGDELVRLLYLT